MAVWAINLIENRHIVTYDIPGAFLQAKWPDDKPTYLRFDGIMVDMLCEINSSLKKRIVYSKIGQKYMYRKLNKTVYGTLLGAILFYKKLATQLHDWDYIMNPYNACIFNKTVNGKQITMKFFIDDLHISCKDMEEIDKLIEDLNNEFRTNF